MLDPEGLRARAVVLRALRRTLEARGYLEVPTPVRAASPALEPTLFAFPVRGGGYLRTSPELALKRVLAAGLPRIYEIGPCLRAREDGAWHATEFTMLEWYRVGATLPDLMEEVEALVAAAADALGVSRPARWERTTVRALFAQTTGLDLATASAADLDPRDADDWDNAFFRRFVEDVEPGLRGACFVEAWPATQAALATIRTDGGWPVSERFEAYLNGIELANAFQELGDAAILRARWDAANAARARDGEPPHPIDEDALAAIARLPRCAGIALGVDRLVAALSGWDGIAPGRVDAGLGADERAPVRAGRTTG